MNPLQEQALKQLELDLKESPVAERALGTFLKNKELFKQKLFQLFVKDDSQKKVLESIPLQQFYLKLESFFQSWQGKIAEVVQQQVEQPRINNSSINQNLLQQQQLPPQLEQPHLEIQIRSTSMKNILTVQFNQQKILKAFQAFSKHIVEYMRQGRLDCSILNEKGILFLKDTIGQNFHFSLEAAPAYKIFPDSVKITANWQELATTQQVLIPNFSLKINDNAFQQSPETLKLLALEEKRFVKMLQYFLKENYRHYTLDEIGTFGNNLRNGRSGAFGFDFYGQKIMEEFANLCLPVPINDLPKGVLFNGPPRVGKTHICKIILKELNFFLIYPMMAAGDFNQPHVGESEKMLNLITDRSDLLPWELCVLFIDEIDGIAPNRKLSNISEHHLNLLSVFLTVMDGNKKKLNLLIMGTSNRLAEMDDAFKQRFDIKLFIGLPNTDSRVRWLKAQITKHSENQNQNVLKNLQALQQEENIKLFLNNTINFTADALKKSLQEIIEKIKDVNGQQVNIKGILMNSLTRICTNDKIYVSNYVPPELVSSLQNTSSDVLEMNKQIGEFQIRKMLTRRVLIDISSEKNFNEAIQLEGKAQQEIRFWKQQESQKSFDDLSRMLLRVQEQAFSDQQCISDCRQLYRIFFMTEEVFFNQLDQVGEFSLEQAQKAQNDIGTLLKVEQAIKFFFLKQQQKQLKNYPLLYCVPLPISCFSKIPLIRSLVQLALEQDINYFEVFDSGFFQKRQLNDDEHILREISAIYEEAMQYKSSMLIFFLDDIADLDKSYSGLRQDLNNSAKNAVKGEPDEPTFSYTMRNSKSFRKVLEMFAQVNEEQENTMHWQFAVSSKNKLIIDLKEKTEWKKTKGQLQSEYQIEQQNQLNRCYRCQQVYVEKSNDDMQCGRHLKNQLYIQHEYDSIKQFLTKILEDEIQYKTEKIKKLSGDQKGALYGDQRGALYGDQGGALYGDQGGAQQVENKEDQIQQLENDIKEIKIKFLNIEKDVIVEMERQGKYYSKQQIEKMIQQLPHFSIEGVKWVCCKKSFLEKGEIQCAHEPFKRCIFCFQKTSEQEFQNFKCIRQHSFSEFMTKQDWNNYQQSFEGYTKSDIKILLKKEIGVLTRDQVKQLTIFKGNSEQDYLHFCCERVYGSDGCGEVGQHELESVAINE